MPAFSSVADNQNSQQGMLNDFIYLYGIKHCKDGVEITPDEGGTDGEVAKIEAAEKSMYLLPKNIF